MTARSAAGQNQGPRNAGEVVPRGRPAASPHGGEKRGDGTELAGAQFQHEDARRRKQPPRIGGDRPVAIKAIGAAVERTALDRSRAPRAASAAMSPRAT